MIHDLYGLAVRENDYASQTFLQWFITEQVEEEKNAGDVVETLKMVGDKSEALFLLDRELGQRRARGVNQPDEPFLSMAPFFKRVGGG